VARVEVLGQGRLVLRAGGSWTDNAHLGRGDAALALVRVLERVRGGRVLFDEYALGAGEHRSPVDLAVSRAGWLFSAHLVLLALLAVAHHAWVREFPRDAPPLGELAPLARARAEAGFLLRAGHVDALAEMLREGALGSLRDPADRERWTSALGSRTVHDLDGLVQLDRDLRGQAGAREAREA
jgi:hypothetical protein